MNGLGGAWPDELMAGQRQNFNFTKNQRILRTQAITFHHLLRRGVVMGGAINKTSGRRATDI